MKTFLLIKTCFVVKNYKRFMSRSLKTLLGGPSKSIKQIRARKKIFYKQATNKKAFVMTQQRSVAFVYLVKLAAERKNRALIETYTHRLWEALRRQSLNDLQDRRMLLLKYGCVHKSDDLTPTMSNCWVSITRKIEFQHYASLRGLATYDQEQLKRDKPSGR